MALAALFRLPVFPPGPGPRHRTGLRRARWQGRIDYYLQAFSNRPLDKLSRRGPARRCASRCTRLSFWTPSHRRRRQRVGPPGEGAGAVGGGIRQRGLPHSPTAGEELSLSRSGAIPVEYLATATPTRVAGRALARTVGIRTRRRRSARSNNRPPRHPAGERDHRVDALEVASRPGRRSPGRARAGSRRAALAPRGRRRRPGACPATRQGIFRCRTRARSWWPGWSTRRPGRTGRRPLRRAREGRARTWRSYGRAGEAAPGQAGDRPSTFTPTRRGSSQENARRLGLEEWIQTSVADARKLRRPRLRRSSTGCSWMPRAPARGCCAAGRTCAGRGGPKISTPWSSCSGSSLRSGPRRSGRAAAGLQHLLVGSRRRTGRMPLVPRGFPIFEPPRLSWRSCPARPPRAGCSPWGRVLELLPNVGTDGFFHLSRGAPASDVARRDVPLHNFLNLQNLRKYRSGMMTVDRGEEHTISASRGA